MKYSSQKRQSGCPVSAKCHKNERPVLVSLEGTWLKLSNQLWAVGGLDVSHFTPRGKLVFEMYLKVSGVRILLQLTEMPESDKVDLSPAKGNCILYNISS